ncbi:MAG: tellurite resistance TerB family protein [Lamprocystis purpurea]|jgi:uncharacterized membrane protein YebE (DUF533 family)|uniref:tellurite resistance TerB family protein n=1 Tax=Lamprocystis purpurea TaxID=61598 RepID=UPI0003A1E2F1|nr:tellurite resistance TerB family protein [Lamprocystis purpurea]MBV5274145.1 tellurite resistance TerB family protein [Lamprocystis purpurea]
MNALDILGAVMQSGMSPQAGDRMGSILGQIMGGQMGGGAPAVAGGTPGGGMFDVLSKVAGAMMGGQGGTSAMGGFPTEILKQVAGAVLGGQAAPGNTATGAGSLAVFGTLAAQALEMAKGVFGGAQAQAGGPTNVRMDNQTAVLAGMRAPANAQEQQQVMDVAMFTLRAMISAAKADGQVDEQERQRLLGKLNEGGISPEEQRFVAEEMQKPIDLDALTRTVPNQQVAAQLYAASLMTIAVDTDAERHYLADLAAKLKLDPAAVTYMHQAVGLS